MKDLHEEFLLSSQTVNANRPFRRDFKASRIRSALADRILLYLYALRKLCRGTISSYFFPQHLHRNVSSSKLLIILFFVGIALSYLFKTIAGGRSSYSTPQFFFVALAAFASDWIEDIESGKGIKAAAYIRVSSGKQARDGFSLDAQKEEIRKLAKRIGVSRLHGFVDAGKSGIDFDRRKLNLILELAEKREISQLLVVEIDRIGRNSRRLISFFSELRDYGVIVNTPQAELDVNRLQDMLKSTIEAWAAQNDNERRTKAVIAGKQESFKQKHWNKPVPRGYERASTGHWIRKAPGWESLIRDVYDLFLIQRNLQTVRTQINRKYRQSLPKQLTHDQIKRILTDTVYIGKPQNLREIVLDVSLSYVTEEKFANVQQLLNQIAERHKPKEASPLNQLVERYGISSLGFLDQLEFHHKQDGGIMVRNGTKIDEGIHRQIFQCKKCHRQYVVPTNSQLNKIRPVSGLCTTRNRDKAAVLGSSIHPLSYHSYSLPKTPREALKVLKRKGITCKGKDSAKIDETQTTLSGWSQSHDES